ncbi:hypothetical protein CO180_04405 [candidate division WWE3 bacterium CG_4_9_14_3_um_filter_41_6]|uniref:Prepilin-type N-terminal cleavage/methylation domain-containing protein n=1 Tax=candidate division WWE3 bacterium CG_4_10_14_0_2_um_filter_41_14 TaxID=1975072 RepID=A0A2M7TF04_UNCKA|nr:MAG: hypothetical protein COY32_06580 [candidate division WWE3 bacterium CG_4_10_14_0_2_um_filter_41_14]PJA38070.1 MAG: hypothetical protein CO180_04405 [candidate division WWE3 bacterium CG_4_9_14_3_um_filter_41_6]
MKLPHNRISSRGFTLIELLVVVVVLGILVGVVIVVINPNVQQEKAKEGVIKGNVDKIGQALIGCVSSQLSPATTCDTFTKIGVIDPSGSPDGSTYQIIPPAVLGTSIQALGTYTQSDGSICGLGINVDLITFHTNRTTSNCHTSW